MLVKFKKLHKNAVTPAYTRVGDAAQDVTATSHWVDEKGNHCYGLGLALELPEGYCAKLMPRSSVAKVDLVLSNAIGLIDENYRGELIMKFKPTKERPEVYTVGDRVGQLMIEKVIKFELVEVEELSDTNRGSGSFGSSGR
jgi:dUTP pyrophosphatase